MADASLLAAEIDGTPLSDDDARELWKEFSAYMDEHRNDFEGFAKQKGWRSLLPEHQSGRAVLRASTTTMLVPTAPSPKAKEPAAKGTAPNKGPAGKKPGGGGKSGPPHRTPR